MIPPCVPAFLTKVSSWVGICFNFLDQMVPMGLLAFSLEPAVCLSPYAASDPKLSVPRRHITCVPSPQCHNYSRSPRSAHKLSLEEAGTVNLSIAETLNNPSISLCLPARPLLRWYQTIPLCLSVTSRLDSVRTSFSMCTP